MLRKAFLLSESAELYKIFFGTKVINVQRKHVF